MDKKQLEIMVVEDNEEYIKDAKAELEKRAEEGTPIIDNSVRCMTKFI